jgi:sugar/nucleoside kinase (ribokinase family)
MSVAVGIGLIALDVVIDDASDERLGEWAGGSMGNVMAILAFLGWDASPIARLDDGEASELIRKDLGRWDVNQRWLSLEPLAPAAVYIERLRNDKSGAIYHRFERFCPGCGSRLPGYRPVTRAAMEPVLDEVAGCDVLYIDRPSSAAVMAARHVKGKGTLVLFEPSARGEERQLSDLAGLADIVKYSADRLSDVDRELIAEAKPPIEIETVGEAGLRFRTAVKWHELRAPQVAARDTAGAGDWTTAGLIHHLRGGARHAPLTAETLRAALADAQAFGALSCRYPGARGVMERLSAKRVLESARALRRGGSHTGRRRSRVFRGTDGAGRFVCEDCA